MSRRWRGSSAVACVAISLWARLAGAEPPDPLQAAERAYDDGVRAQTSGDYARAARLFAEADALAPNPVALEAALTAAVLADDAVLGMALAQRAAREVAPPASLTEAVSRAVSKLGARAGYVEIRCAGCEAKLDGAPVVVGRAHATAVGPHQVDATFDGVAVEPLAVIVSGGQRVLAEISAPAPPALPPPPPVAPRERSGVHPALFFVGAGLTVGLGAGAIASALDLYSIADEFEASPSRELAEAGEAAELRTYLLEGATALLGLTTLAVGVFATDWQALSPAGPVAKVTLGPAWVGLRVEL